MRRLGLTLLLVLLAGAAPAVAADPPDPGRTDTGTVTSGGSDWPYILYTPTSYRQGRAMPLLVMVHGCQTSAQQELEVTQFNKLAEREGFAVVYPEVDKAGQEFPGALNHCWKFFDPTAYFRGNSDPAAIVAVTRAVMAARTIDAERVYLVGVSAGGLMASALAATDPDLYAAVGLVASAGYADGLCFTSGQGMPVESGAQLAFTQMAERARVVPVIGIGSDADLAFPARCIEKAVEQGLRTSNLVLSGRQDRPLKLTPASTREDQVPNGGHRFAVSQFRDPGGCLVAERWIINGAPHTWPGGTTDPKLKGYVDNASPDGAQATWAFLRRYTRSATAMPCAEAPVVQPAPARITRCAARWLSVRVPAGARRIRAAVDGYRVKVRVARDRVRVRIPAAAPRVRRVVVRGRTVQGRPFTRRAVDRRCEPV